MCGWGEKHRRTLATHVGNSMRPSIGGVWLEVAPSYTGSTQSKLGERVPKIGEGMKADYLVAYFKCPQECIRIEQQHLPNAERGYFLFGEDATCFGTLSGPRAASDPLGTLPDAAESVQIDSGIVRIPFDPSEVVDNLHREAYVGEWRRGALFLLSKPYYFFRPLLPVVVRRPLQRLYLRGWDKLRFPRWPVDCSVDSLMEQLLMLTLKANRAECIPFIWFWPEGKSACAMMTHDVETEVGRDFCSELMDLDDSFGIKSSFQVIPEERYSVSLEFLDVIRQRGHEVVIHDLNHDGHLYRNREQFVERVAKINEYGRKYMADGFRAAVLYRKQLWYDELKFAYDMSVPNVAHLDPQRGGCCTVMPYFIGDILEIPVTAIQDYSLFNILNEYSTRIWRQQTAIIAARHGLMSFIIHPDYVIKQNERSIYCELLQHLVDLRDNHSVWLATPGEVNTWWRRRAAMRVVRGRNGWKIENGDNRARLAYARLDGGRIVYEIEGEGTGSVPVSSAGGSRRSG